MRIIVLMLFCAVTVGPCRAADCSSIQDAAARLACFDSVAKAPKAVVKKAVPVWESPISKRRFTVDNSIKSRHTANGVLKQAGLPKNF